MMIDTVFPYALGFLGGLGLGILYFGGLWLTVRKIPFSRKPHQLLFMSTVIRLGSALFIFFLVGKSHPVIFLIMLPGFFGVRYFMIHRMAKQGGRPIHAT